MDCMLASHPSSDDPNRRQQPLRNSLGLTPTRPVLLWTTLSIYLLARLCQLYADRLPTLLIVLLHVVPPALFTIIHGSRLYGQKGFLAFAASCLGFATIFETLGLRTGFPFGHYSFTNVMGPKLFGLPFLLVLAYLGIGYVSWVLALLILRCRNTPLSRIQTIAQPLLAATIMVAWDVTMDPDWSTLDRAWIWRDGGPWFGVPLTNFLGWFLTAWAFYQAFALSQYARPRQPAPASNAYWRSAIALYAICALGNLLILRLPMAPPIVADPSGRLWLTADILEACGLCSVLIMLPFAALAWFRTPRLES